MAVSDTAAAMIPLPNLSLRRKENTIASSNEGNAYSASMMKTSALSIHPPMKPETRPSGTPITPDMTTEATTTSSAVRAPQIIRLRMS